MRCVNLQGTGSKIKVDKKGDQECIFQHSQSPILPLFQ